MDTRWIDLDGAVNMRDLGGLPTTDGGTTRYGRVLRSDNLQGLTDGDVEHLVTDLKLRHVVDLRSATEVALEGPGPLTRVPEVTVHHLSFFPEGGRTTDVEADVVDIDAVLPWQGQDTDAPEQQRSVTHYLGYLDDRPDSMVAALRLLAHADGASVVHCAAGKDRAGVVSALALEIAGATREAIVADYVMTGERLERILARLRSSDTYAADLDARPTDTHLPHAATMRQVLAAIDERDGGPLRRLARHGWTDADTTALRATLRD